jgi:alpha-tubulin suppressor-like RCC1 family protein
VEFGLAEMVILVESKTGPDAANEVYTCGDNAFGQLGLGDYDSDMKKVPQLVTFFAMAGHSVISVCGGDNVLFAVTNKGEVFGWGCGETQQLGADKMDDQRIPVKIIFPSDPMSGEELYVYKMAANHINCAVVDRNGALFIWGYSFHDKPTIVSTLFDESIELTDVALGWGEMLLR